MSQRVLFVSPFMFPEPISTGRYNTHLVQALAQQGHQVEVIAAYPTFPDWKPARTDAQLPGVFIVRGGGWLRYPRNPFLRRLLLESWFAIYALFAALSRVKRADLVCAVVPPSLFLLLLALFLPRRLRLVCIVHDLQAVHARNSSGCGHRMLGALIEFVERRALRRCERVIFVSSSIARIARERLGVAADRSLVAYPFVNVDRGSAPDAATRQRVEQLLSADGAKKHVVYCGALGLKQNPRELAGFIAEAVRRIDDVCFHVFSSGPLFEELRRDPALSHQRIRFGPLVDESLLACLYAHADLNLVPQALGTADGSLPSKLPNLLACGARILAIGDPDSEVHELVTRFSAGRLVNTWNPAELTRALDEELRAPRPASRTAPPAELLEMFDVRNLVRVIVGA